MPGHNISPGVDVRPLRKARNEFGEVFGEEHAAEGAAVEGGQRVEDLPLGLGQRVAQGGDQPRVELAVDAVAPVEQVLHLGRLVEGGQTANEWRKSRVNAEPPILPRLRSSYTGYRIYGPQFCPVKIEHITDLLHGPSLCLFY